MSKAFTKEDDSEPQRSTRVRSNSGLPPGALNYLTAAGARRMQEELEKTRGTDPGCAMMIQRILDSATIVKPSDDPPEEVLFGTEVELRDREGGIRTFRIVGVDEEAWEPGHVSWLSPIAKSLLGAALNQRVMLKIDGAATSFTVVRVRN